MKLISYQSKKEELLKRSSNITRPFNVLGGAITGEMKLKATGNKTKSVFTDEMFTALGKKPQGEMTSKELTQLIQQIVIDIASEQANTPPMYTEIYEEVVNANFPQSLKVKDIIGLKTAFGIVGDGEAVPLADYKCEDLGTVSFKTFATGYSITEEWVAFNQSWKVEQANKAIGQAHCAILDHIHFAPIIEATYEDEAKTEKVDVKNGSELQVVYASLRKGLKDALGRKNRRGFVFRPSVALCNSSTALDVISAIKGEVEKGKTVGSLALIEKVIMYDGWSGEVNGVTHEFKAPQDNEVYLIEPKIGFKALVKKALTRIQQRGSVLKLSNLEVAEFFMRAVVADIAGSVHKVIVG